MVENNILINNTFHPHVWFKESGDVFTRNIVMSGYRPIGVYDWEKMIDYNIFTDSVALFGNQKSYGTDHNSIAAVVKFLDPLSGNYGVDNSCTEIFRIGFRNFDMNCFGVTEPRLKAISRTPLFSLPIQASVNEQDKMLDWKGMVIKDLTTIEERSATGMDSERGVYVLSVDPLGCKLRDYIMPNDVLLRIGGIDINNCNDLLQGMEKLDLEHDIKIMLFRNQKENYIIVPVHTFN